MNKLNFHTPARTALCAALAAFSLGALAATPAHADRAPQQHGSAAWANTGPAAGAAGRLVETDPASGTVFMNGGIGQDEQGLMRRDAAHWPLRMVFSDRADNEFAAGVNLQVFNASGQAVLGLKDAGPMTYARVPQGEYKIVARYDGKELVRNARVGAKGTEVQLHWRS